MKILKMVRSKHDNLMHKTTSSARFYKAWSKWCSYTY